MLLNLPDECLELRYTAHSNNPGYLGRDKVIRLAPLLQRYHKQTHRGPPHVQALSWSSDVAAWLTAGLQPGIAQDTWHQVLVCVGSWAKLGFLDRLSFQQAQPLVEALCSSLLQAQPGKQPGRTLQLAG